jgi:phage recombination protein Bet
MSNNVATIDRQASGQPSIINSMAERYGMMPQAFEATLRATVVPKDCSREQFAAFLIVAKEYDLNPVLKEIYAFPAKGGGIQPIVSIDGWMNLINSHTAMDGLEFDDHFDDKGEITAVSARIWRKDRSHPIVVTEYMVECKRSTDPWKQWPRRMLRHKAAIQCARYAFGFAGIIDPDEADRLTDIRPMRDVTPPPAPAPPPAPRAVTNDVAEVPSAAEPGHSEAMTTAAPKSRQRKAASKSETAGEMPPFPGTEDAETFLAWADQVLAAVPTDAGVGALQDRFNDLLEPHRDALMPPDRDELDGAYARHEKRFEG